MMHVFLADIVFTTSKVESAASAVDQAASAIDMLSAYAHIFIVAFMGALLATPLARRLAEHFGVVDRPDSSRKTHAQPIAYLGGLAVLTGLVIAIGVSYAFVDDDVPISFAPVPMAVVIGMFAIALTGLADDVWGWDPRLKIAGQLVAAAALAIENVGVNVAAGVLVPMFGHENLIWHLPTPMGEITIDVVYWVGTALIAVFVLGGCNAANLIDGLDGLLSGVVAIVAIGLLAISLLMLPQTPADSLSSENGVLAGARIVLCMALLGAVLGFLPHNFKPAVIFLGDCGSLLLGYMCVVLILMLGEHGQTHLVFAGLIVFSVPIIDTTLAIIRRKLAGVPMSAADDQHLHHQLKRALGGVRRAVFTLYAMSAIFAFVGVTLAALVLKTELRVRVVYAIAIVLFSFVGVIAVKAARRHQRAIMAKTIESAAKTMPVGTPPDGVPAPPRRLTESAKPGSGIEKANPSGAPTT